MAKASFVRLLKIQSFQQAEDRFRLFFPLVAPRLDERNDLRFRRQVNLLRLDLCPLQQFNCFRSCSEQCTVQRLKKNLSVSTNTLSDLCTLLDCELYEVAEFHRDA